MVNRFGRKVRTSTKLHCNGADKPIQASKNSIEARARQPYRNHPICHGKRDALSSRLPHPFCFCRLRVFARSTLDQRGEQFLPSQYPVHSRSQPDPRRRSPWNTCRLETVRICPVSHRRLARLNVIDRFAGLDPSLARSHSHFFARTDALRQEKSDVNITCDQAVPSSSGVAHWRAPDRSL
jgi:hypothetical protein